MENTKVGLWVRLVAAPGKESAVESFLRSALPLVNQEVQTLTWYAVRLNPHTFGIFDTFAGDEGRNLHLNGAVAAALMENGGELLAEPPSIEKIEILASK